MRRLGLPEAMSLGPELVDLPDTSQDYLTCCCHRVSCSFPLSNQPVLQHSIWSFMELHCSLRSAWPQRAPATCQMSHPLCSHGPTVNISSPPAVPITTSTTISTRGCQRRHQHHEEVTAIVNFIVITMCGVTWVLDLSW